MDVAFHFARPAKKSPQVAALAPHKFPEFQKADLRHLDASVGFDPPQQVGTAPGRKAVSLGRVPEKAEA